MIALINLAAITNIKNFPLLAEYGLSIIVFMILSSLFFFIPVSLVSAELASAIPERGIYTWVREGLSPRFGFLAIWLQWVSNVIWYPTILTFIAATFAYLIDPALATNNKYIFCTVLATFWPITFLNFLGVRVSGWFSSCTAVIGTLVPIALIIIMGFWWALSGHPSQIVFSWKGLLPNLTSINQLVLLSGILLGLAGLEMSAVHAREVENPRRSYPKAIFLSASLIVLFAIFGALAIAIVIPTTEIQLASGGVEAFRYMFHELGIEWATPLLAAIMTFGALGMMSTWIIGPSRGLLATTEHGDLPPFFKRTNRRGMPVAILITQASIVTALSSVFLFMPSVNSSYWILVALSSSLYMIAYVLLFLAAIRLRKKTCANTEAFQVPGGKKGLWTICIMGIFGAGFGCLVGFFPPSQLDTGGILHFEAFLIGGALLFCAIPFFIYKMRKPHWRR
jgi:glutamate:GABA antiporter